MDMSVCLRVCLSPHISPERTSGLHQSLRACYLWPRLDPLPVELRYGGLLPVVWMTSCSHKMARTRRCKRGSHLLARWKHVFDTVANTQTDSLWGSEFDVCDCLVCFRS